MGERALGQKDFGLFSRGEPLGENVRVGEGGVGHWGQEVERNPRQAALLQVAGQTLKQVKGHAAGVARHEDVSPVLQRDGGVVTKLSDHGVGLRGRGLGEAGQDEDVGVLERSLVHGPRGGW